MMRAVASAVALGCACSFLACGGTSHRLGGDPDAGTEQGGTAGMTSSTGGQGDSGAGNTSSGGVVTAGASPGGFGGIGGTPGTGLPPSCEQQFDPSVVGCDVGLAMRTHCARAGCHNLATRAADLDLTMDAFLIARVLDVPARLVSTRNGVGCYGAMCPLPGSVKLVDTVTPEASWMLTKMAAFDFDTPNEGPDMGCGTAMPYPPGGMGFTSERHACLRAFFLAIAEMGVPCDVPRDPLPELPICPE